MRHMAYWGFGVFTGHQTFTLKVDAQPFIFRMDAFVASAWLVGCLPVN